MQRLLRNTSILAAATLAAQLLLTITYLVVARQETPGQFGFVLAGIGLVTFLLAVTDFGINSLAVRHLARQPQDLPFFHLVLSAKVAASLTMGLLWIGAAAFLATGSSTFTVLVPLGVYLMAVDLTNSLNVVARASEVMSTVAATVLAEKVACLGFVIVALAMIDSAALALTVGMAIGGVTSAVLALIRIDRRWLRLSALRHGSLLPLWRQATGFGLNAMSAQIQRADVTLVALMAGNVQAGYFGVPSRMANLLNLVPNALSASMLPRMASAGSDREALRQALRLIGAVFVLTCCSSLVVFLAAPTIVPLAFGTAYEPAVEPLRIYLLGAAIMSLNGPVAAILQANNLQSAVARSTVGGVTVGIFLIAGGAVLDGARGAACGFVLLHVTIAVLLWFAGRHFFSGQLGAATLDSLNPSEGSTRW